MKRIVKYTIFFIISIFFSILVSTNIASKAWEYSDNGITYDLDLGANGIETYEDFIEYIKTSEGIVSEDRLKVYTKDDGGNLEEVDVNNIPPREPLASVIPSGKCVITYYYIVKVNAAGETYYLQTVGHTFDHLSPLNRSGYKFKGWYVTTTSGRELYDFSELVYQDIELTAKYKRSINPIFFVLGGLVVASITLTIIRNVKFPKKKEEEVK